MPTEVGVAAPRITGWPPVMMSVDAIAVGGRAADWLRPPRQGTVLHLSGGACHFVDGDGRLLSLVTSEHDMGPHGLLLPVEIGPLRRIIEPGRRATVTPAGLRLGPLTVRSRSARPFDCRPDWGA